MEALFGNPVIEKILFFILANDKGYASQIRKRFDIPLYSVQKAMARLEQGGIIAYQSEGKTHVYSFNPRYPFLNELKKFLNTAYQYLPTGVRKKIYDPPIRKRPRRKGKSF